MKTEISTIRTKHMNLLTHVATLEESRKTIDMQVELAITQTVAKLEVEFTRKQAQATFT